MAHQEGERVRVRGLGSGVVRAVRRDGRCLVEIGAARMLCRPDELEAVEPAGATRRRPAAAPAPAAAGPAEPDPALQRRLGSLDLHGLTVEEALRLVDDRLNEALLAGLGRLEIVHGKGQGRIRAALHRHLQAMPSVRRFELDPRNPGVTHLYL
ncbi:MAG TPA: Smr/MutS family protein [Vicinamibacterales bacterium]|nr:Smr/MutS family protein [Vicinamibacterales bacterium]